MASQVSKKECAELARVIASAPPLPAPAVAFRGVNAAWRDAHAGADTLSEPYFVSTSLAFSTAAGFSDCRLAVAYYLTSEVQCLPVCDWSDNEEEEVILAPRAAFALAGTLSKGAWDVRVFAPAPIDKAAALAAAKAALQ